MYNVRFVLLKDFVYYVLPSSRRKGKALRPLRALCTLSWGNHVMPVITQNRPAGIHTWRILVTIPWTAHGESYLVLDFCWRCNVCLNVVLGKVLDFSKRNYFTPVKRLPRSLC